MWGRAVWALRGLFDVPAGLWPVPYDDPTTTTTIATPQCNRDCSGLSCPPGEVGVYLRTQCGCAPEPGCGGSGGVCGGDSPPRGPTGGCPHHNLQLFCFLRGPPPPFRRPPARP